MIKKIAQTLFVSFILAGNAYAGGNLQVKTTLVKIPTGSKAGAFMVANTGDGPVSAQIKVMKWSQVDGKDVTVDDNSIVVSPSIITVGGDQEKTIRLIRKEAPPAGDDVMYRILVQQIPGADKTPGVQILMNYSVPLYVLGEKPASGEIRCAKSNSDMVCKNTSGHAQRFGATKTKSGDVISKGLLGYVLPQSTRVWPGVFKNIKAGDDIISSVNGEDVTIRVETSL